LAAGALAAWYGFQVPDADRLMASWLDSLDIWLHRGDHPRHPVFLIFMAGAIVVTVVAGVVEGILRKKYFDQNYKSFVAKYREASRMNRTIFFNYLFRAYEKWRQNHPDAPDNINVLCKVAGRLPIVAMGD